MIGLAKGSIAASVPNLCAILYLAFTLPLLLTLALLTPPWQNPDEPTHMARIVQIAHSGLIGYREWGTAGGISDRAVYDAYRPVEHAAMHPEQRLSREDLVAANAVRWSPELAYTSFPNTAQYPPVFYLPAAAAYWFGRAGGLAIDRTLLLARLVNASLFAVITAFALNHARRTRPLLAAILLLPTTLSLACAAGQDSLLIAAVASAVALLDRIIAEQRAATRFECGLVALLLICIAAARPPYAGFLLAVLLLKPRPSRSTFILLGVSACLVLTWCLVVAWHVSVRLGGADASRQLAFLQAQPGRIPLIILNTVRRSTGAYWHQFIGVVGWTDTQLPTAIILLHTAVLVLAAAALPGKSRLKRIPFAAVAFALATTFCLQYLTWTWPGQMEVTGVLGRYFIPAALVLSLAIPGTQQLIPPAAAWFAVMGAACLTPAIMIHAEIVRYFLR